MYHEQALEKLDLSKMAMGCKFMDYLQECRSSPLSRLLTTWKKPKPTSNTLSIQLNSYRPNEGLTQLPLFSREGRFQAIEKDGSRHFFS